MLKRTYDPVLVDLATREYQYNFDPQEWLNNKSNVALINEKDDLTLFQLLSPSIYFGHYFYKSRGREAVKTATEVLKEFFTNYEAKAIVGLTPITHLGAQWLSKKIGFKQQGLVDGLSGKEVLFVLTKEQWLNKEEDDV